MVEAVLEYLFRAILYFFQAIVHSMKTMGTSEWPCTEATITAQPTASHGYGCLTAEMVYSYRVEEELYTGLHEEPFLLADSLADYISRFSNGRKFVVRVTPSEPQISIVRELDQVINLGQSRGESRQ